MKNTTMVIKHSLNETRSELTLELKNLLLRPCVHLPMAQSQTLLPQEKTQIGTAGELQVKSYVY